MITYMDYTKADKHILGENGFDPRFCGKCEAVMSQGNGYLGLRAAAEENYSQTTRGLFVAGTFNRFDMAEVSELPNAADCTQMEIDLNGERFSLETGTILHYSREIDLKTGMLKREILWESPKGVRYAMTFKRFVSLKRLHVYGITVDIRLEGGKDIDEAEVTVESGINGRMTNSGTQHFSDGDKRYYDKKYLQLVQTTIESGITFVHNAVHEVSKDSDASGSSFKRSLQMPRRQIIEKITGTIKRDETVHLMKLCNVYTTRDFDAPAEDQIKEVSLEALKETEKIGFDALFDESVQAWKDQVWDAAPIEIESDNPLDALAMDFAQYHLRIIVPAHDHRMNIGAKGLSGEGYKGHCFWDTEIFLLPYYSFTAPQTARKLEEYRYLTLPGARRKAKENHFDGAMFPWESAWIEDGDVTPLYVGADVVTGRPTKVWSGLIEQHITADVAYGVWQYYLTTGDQDFMDKYGYEIILDAARFWSSRLEWSDEDQMYHINDVIGADEYKEHCNDNSLTNYLARWNMKKALECCKKPEVYEKFKDTLALEKYIPLWEKQIPLIFLNQPREDGVIGQDRDYLSYPQIDLTKYKKQTKVDTILLDYNQTQLSKIQVTKQADLLILLFMLDDLFPYDIKKACWEYYEPKTTHDSSLSYCTHCVLASDISDPMAYPLFKKSWEIDMGEIMTTSDAGIHTAAMGGIWQCVVMGFGGLRLSDHGLRITPKLPKNWKSLSFTIQYQGETVKVTESWDEDIQKIVVENMTGRHPVNLYIGDKQITV